ncbi:unnamed protein product [Lepeophtheirus salmonis]|uniref:(salmon louse) hypothetical protein n=1 Tax=Lepeophtheirus salmonis TaxID=72036 RepID=A0A7R8DBH3_LEPSM|nr:unnamed protein product [Lepeophtheirus salmonis]CAF3035308.1 unnamed protein product [Lepeophtheirus salmonis]
MIVPKVALQLSVNLFNEEGIDLHGNKMVDVFSNDVISLEAICFYSIVFAWNISGVRLCLWRRVGNFGGSSSTLNSTDPEPRTFPMPFIPKCSSSFHLFVSERTKTTCLMFDRKSPNVLFRVGMLTFSTHTALSLDTKGLAATMFQSILKSTDIHNEFLIFCCLNIHKECP